MIDLWFHGCSFRFLSDLPLNHLPRPESDFLRNIEATISRVCDDIKRKKRSSGAKKPDVLSKVINPCGRLPEGWMPLRV